MKRNKDNPRYYEMFIGFVEDILIKNNETEVRLNVADVLHPSYVNLRLNTSVLTPGAIVIIKDKSFNSENLSDGDILVVSSVLEKQNRGMMTFYVTNGTVKTRQICESEAAKILIAEMREMTMEQLDVCEKNSEKKDRGSKMIEIEDIYSANDKPSVSYDRHNCDKESDGEKDHDVSSQYSTNNTEEYARKGYDEYHARSQSRAPFQTYDKLSVYKEFLTNHTPAKIEEMLNERVIGQKELTKFVADFIYYHALRQLDTDLPLRPMLISGPSGSGKTEVWRVARKLFGEIFKIEIVDGASMTEEGWKGDNKLSDHINREMSDGGILIIDEFDKLAKPKYEAGGSNVAASMQSEFLKLLEGEYVKRERGRYAMSTRSADMQTDLDDNGISSKKMGVVLVGAFEDINVQKQSRVGFGAQDYSLLSGAKNITDEEYINFGVLPELVGRIAIKVTTNQLSDNEYIQIIYNPFSRVSTLINTFKRFGVDLSDNVQEDEIKDLIKRSKSNKTGVRWVSSQIENKMLEAIREQGIDKTMLNDTAPNGQKPQPIDEWIMKHGEPNKRADASNSANDEFFF